MSCVVKVCTKQGGGREASSRPSSVEVQKPLKAFARRGFSTAHRDPKEIDLLVFSRSLVVGSSLVFVFTSPLRHIFFLCAEPPPM